jgi:DEAD/DEAH box helicase domain-containing protein
VHFVATSATIAGSGDNTEEQLRAFLADIAGVSADRVSVVYGQRQVPALSKALPSGQLSSPDLATLSSLAPQERFAALAADPNVRQWRSALIQQARPLSELARMAWRDSSEKVRKAALQLLDLCAQAADDKDEPLLPLRGHFFHRALNGLWACAHAACAGRRQTPSMPLAGSLAKSFWNAGSIAMPVAARCTNWCSAVNVALSISLL